MADKEMNGITKISVLKNSNFIVTEVKFLYNWVKQI
jgi:hypothetical protein